MNLDKSQQLEALYQEMITANVCPELAAGAHCLVMGEGNPNADIVFIGEAPGKKEDELGLPFVGASGRFLNEMLAAADMDRSDVYITNIVKYRPPNNRDPSREEKVEFWPYLARQLEIINPTVIVTLGRHSMEFFLPKVRIGEVHGEAIEKEIIYDDNTSHSWLIVPLYHPAAALYNGSLRQTLVEDFLRVPKYVHTHKLAKN